MSKPFWQEEPAPTSQRERRKQAFREKIMQAAITLFERDGCDATTLEDICELAEVSRPTFYSYYESKRELIAALAEKLWLNMAKEVVSLSLANHDSTKQYIKAFFKMTRSEMTRYSRLEREIIRQTMASELGEKSNMDLLANITGLFETVYAAGKKRGDIGVKFPVDFLAEMAMGGISTVMMRWAVDEEYPIEKRLKQLENYLISSLDIQEV